jgi:hypothetical protein
MTALGIAFIGIGAALICVGVIFWLRARRTDPAGPDDALEEQDRRSSDENRLAWTSIALAPHLHTLLGVTLPTFRDRLILPDGFPPP